MWHGFTCMVFSLSSSQALHTPIDPVWLPPSGQPCTNTLEPVKSNHLFAILTTSPRTPSPIIYEIPVPRPWRKHSWVREDKVPLSRRHSMSRNDLHEAYTCSRTCTSREKYMYEEYCRSIRVQTERTHPKIFIHYFVCVQTLVVSASVTLNNSW